MQSTQQALRAYSPYVYAQDSLSTNISLSLPSNHPRSNTVDENQSICEFGFIFC